MNDEIYEMTKDEPKQSLNDVIREIHDGVYKEAYTKGREDERRIFTKECIHCKKMIDCKGRPEQIERCIDYEQR